MGTIIAESAVVLKKNRNDMKRLPQPPPSAAAAGDIGEAGARKRV